MQFAVDYLKLNISTGVRDQLTAEFATQREAVQFCMGITDSVAWIYDRVAMEYTHRSVYGQVERIWGVV